MNSLNVNEQKKAQTRIGEFVMDKMKMSSLDITSENIEKIGKLFPNCITETIETSVTPPLPHL